MTKGQLAHALEVEKIERRADQRRAEYTLEEALFEISQLHATLDLIENTVAPFLPNNMAPIAASSETSRVAIMVARVVGRMEGAERALALTEEAARNRLASARLATEQIRLANREFEL